METKIVILAGIALCAMLLVSPALASDTDTLGIYGNANEDDTIDMRDLTYVKLIFFGKKPETDLADAKYDGKINPLDFIQIKLIIVGKEKELTLVDGFDRIVTVSMPVERIIVTNQVDAAIIKALGAEDKVVGVASTVTVHEVLFPELSQLPSIGSTWAPDAESAIALEPDLVIGVGSGAETLAEQLEPVGIPVIATYCIDLFTYEEVVKKRAYVLGKKDKADEYIDWYQGYLDIIAERVEGLSEEDKSRVFFTFSIGEEDWYVHGSDQPVYHGLFELAGGISITAGLPGVYFTVDPEWVIKQNPEMVLLRAVYPKVGYGTDDLSEMITVRDEFMSRPEAELMDAGKEGEVYVTSYELLDTAWFVGLAYMAKWFHPELFDDLDPNEIHQEWLTEFQRLDYDLDEHGTFVYHPEKNPDGR